MFFCARQPQREKLSVGVARSGRAAEVSCHRGAGGEVATTVTKKQVAAAVAAAAVVAGAAAVAAVVVAAVAAAAAAAAAATATSAVAAAGAVVSQRPDPVFPAAKFGRCAAPRTARSRSIA